VHIILGDDNGAGGLRPWGTPCAASKKSTKPFKTLFKNVEGVRKGDRNAAMLALGCCSGECRNVGTAPGPRWGKKRREEMGCP